jgi:hypothetical protein
MSSSNSTDSITGIKLNGRTFREGRIYTNTRALRKTAGAFVDEIFNINSAPLSWSFDITKDRLTLFASKDFTPDQETTATFKGAKYIFEGKAKTRNNSQVANSFSFKKETIGLFQGTEFFTTARPKVTLETISSRRYKESVQFDERPTRKSLRNSILKDFVQLSSPLSAASPPQIDNRSGLGSLLPKFSGDWWNQPGHIQSRVSV